MSNPDYDIWCLGNVLTYVVGKGNHYFHEIRNNPVSYPPTPETLSLCENDALLSFRHRVANLRKLFPYIPQRLSAILMRFSSGRLPVRSRRVLDGRPQRRLSVNPRPRSGPWEVHDGPGRRVSPGG
jgi:hypothetical protein